MDGYFLIYITADVYEEYVTVDKTKRYVMMVGHGINQTIITGNRSVVDGWTNFDSATFVVLGRGFVAMDTGASLSIGSLALKGTKTPYMGRPWKAYSLTVFMQSFMDSLINPAAGWHIGDEDFALSTLYYAEYNNRGPGLDTTYRVTWPGYHVINATVASNFTVSNYNFLIGDAWLPPTGDGSALHWWTYVMISRLIWFAI
ncbi:putative pectinesterase/pectinesterase inhibitor 20 [Morella rubra]|uniref:Putative pectinesterase/pectinesterase inhibitor 20 n=1 Tax=Morella rubra TaxID=262757 RepID=A0A6A1V459_9ROSI|nr:putative pectinesterase/pectinesterase inhibitor 20 [Morella rubra]